MPTDYEARNRQRDNDDAKRIQSYMPRPGGIRVTNGMVAMNAAELLALLDLLSAQANAKTEG